MVNIDDIYMLMATVAIAHEIPETQVVNTKAFENLLCPPITVANSMAGMLISSQRDQIEILIANNKTDIRDLSGRKNFSSSKICKVVEYFISNFKLKITSYGVNFLLRVPHPEPGKWIVENVLSSGILEKTGKALVSGSGIVSLKSGRKTWNVGFESIDGNKIGINFNANEIKGELPGEVAIRKELKKQWDLLVKFLGDLGLLHD